LEFKNDLVWKRKRKIPPLQMIYPFIRKNTEYMRFDWIAGGLQNYTEEMLVKLTENAIRNTGIKKVALSGGTFMNVKANQKISEINELENLFIFPSCGDETNAIGAAYYVYKQKNKHGKINPIKHLYYGPDETDDGNVLKEIEIFRNTTTTKFSVTHYDKIESEIARLLVEGAIVARCKGPMEFGARALGNRSILSDASDLSKITIINNMIKMRDFWMPFAPVILKERENDYIINPKKIEASFMVITFNSTDRYKEFIGGIQQNDLTARPQIITEELNPDYYRILKEYERNTGKGVLINTSFNLHGLPIVYGPKEALYVFENSGLKILALGNYLIKKIDL
jgi:carbamoyltransferase